MGMEHGTVSECNWGNQQLRADILTYLKEPGVGWDGGRPGSEGVQERLPPGEGHMKRERHVGCACGLLGCDAGAFLARPVDGTLHCVVEAESW